jgi:hypothetical protein
MGETAVASETMKALEARGAALAGLLNTATAGLVEVIAEALTTGAWQGWGIVSPEQWAALRFGLSPARARRLVAAARAVPALPAVRAAFAAGELSEDHVAAIAHAGLTPDHDTQAADLARHATVNQLRRALAALPRPEPTPAGDDAAGDERGDDDDHTGNGPDGPPRRWLTSTHHDDGTWTLHARTEPHEGALIDKALAAATGQLLRARRPDTAHHDDPPAQGTIAAIDALVHLAKVALDAMDPDTRHTPHHIPNERYLLNVHLRTDTPDHATLHLGPTLPAHLTGEVCCDALIRAWVTDHTGTVALGRTHRVVDPKLRTVIEHRDNGCAIPGCDRTRWVVIHHITPWEHGGRTDPDNLLAVCPAHHTAIHNHDITIHGRPHHPDQPLHFRDRRGRTVAPTPPRPPTTDPHTTAHTLGLPPPTWTNRTGERAQWRDFTWN